MIRLLHICLLWVTVNASSFNLGIEDRVSCPAGRWYKEETRSCVAVELGFYSPTNASQQFPCGKGTFGQAGASSCTPCFPGMFNNLIGQSSCQACPPGSFQSEYGAKVCQQCLAVRHEGPGSDAIEYEIDHLPHCALKRLEKKPSQNEGRVSSEITATPSPASLRKYSQESVRAPALNALSRSLLLDPTSRPASVLGKEPSVAPTTFVPTYVPSFSPSTNGTQLSVHELIVADDDESKAKEWKLLLLCGIIIFSFVVLLCVSALLRKVSKCCKRFCHKKESCTESDPGKVTSISVGNQSQARLGALKADSIQYPIATTDQIRFHHTFTSYVVKRTDDGKIIVPEQEPGSSWVSVVLDEGEENDKYESGQGQDAK